MFRFRSSVSGTGSTTLLPSVPLMNFQRVGSRLLIGGDRMKKRADSAPSLPGCGGAKQDVFSICW